MNTTYQLTQADFDACRKLPDFIDKTDAEIQAWNDSMFVGALGMTSLEDASQEELDAATAASQERIAVFAAQPDPDYRKKRAVAYRQQLTQGDPTFEEATGDTFDAVIKKVIACETAFGALKAQLVTNGAITQIEADAISTAEAEFDQMLADIVAIKAAHPKPS